MAPPGEWRGDRETTGHCPHSSFPLTRSLAAPCVRMTALSPRVSGVLGSPQGLALIFIPAGGGTLPPGPPPPLPPPAQASPWPPPPTHIFLQPAWTKMCTEHTHHTHFAAWYLGDGMAEGTPVKNQPKVSRTVVKYADSEYMTGLSLHP